jgi:hypothetical protein
MSKPCPKMERCPVFPEFRNQSALRVLQTLYCEGDFGRCARFQIASRGEMPPITLLPDGRHMKQGA